MTLLLGCVAVIFISISFTQTCPKCGADWKGRPAPKTLTQWFLLREVLNDELDVVERTIKAAKKQIAEGP